MEVKKLMLIINPHSGVNSKEGLQHSLINKLQEMGFDVDMRITRARGHAGSLAKEAAAKGYGIVAVCGGDGTVNEVASEICGTDVVMAIIPSGSGNGLARHLGIPVDELLALDVIKEAKVKKCDCAVAGDHRFFCTAGLGFDAYISLLFDKQKQRGSLNYIRLVMKEFTHYKPRLYRITAGGKTIERRAAVLTVCNASQYGNNAFVAPQASVSDGLLDIFILEECNNLAMVIAGFEVMAGIADQNKHVEIMRVPEATIELEPGGCMHIDGEPIEHAPLSIHFSILDKRLNVLAGTLAEKVTPFVTPLELALKQATYNITKPFR